MTTGVQASTGECKGLLIARGCQADLGLARLVGRSCQRQQTALTSDPGENTVFSSSSLPFVLACTVLLLSLVWRATSLTMPLTNNPCFLISAVRMVFDHVA